MNKKIFLNILGFYILATSLSSCIVVPERQAAYYPSPPPPAAYYIAPVPYHYYGYRR